MKKEYTYDFSFFFCRVRGGGPHFDTPRLLPILQKGRGRTTL
jgi:hypothetical protein